MRRGWLPRGLTWGYKPGLDEIEGLKSEIAKLKVQIAEVDAEIDRIRSGRQPH